MRLQCQALTAFRSQCLYHQTSQIVYADVPTQVIQTRDPANLPGTAQDLEALD